ncbi:hypothetical protein DFS34DRAFT_614674 [Phlyctochytrium arcticum]|nr:hypothetical protein DFS34DRAFT_614674 [Phlyctochytrium arcticum]
MSGRNSNQSPLKTTSRPKRSEEDPALTSELSRLARAENTPGSSQDQSPRTRDSKQRGRPLDAAPHGGKNSLGSAIELASVSPELQRDGRATKRPSSRDRLKALHSAEPSPSRGRTPPREVIGEGGGRHSPRMGGLYKQAGPPADTENYIASPRPSASDDNYGAYDEDFEAYDDEFEDFDDEDAIPSGPIASTAKVGGLSPQQPARDKSFMDLNEVRKAMEAENERASVRQSEKVKMEVEQTVAKRERVASALPQRRIVGLESGRKQAAKIKKESEREHKQVKRAKDLSKMITLDVCKYEFLDLNPMNEYELYIRNFGSSNAVQASTQSNEDKSATETQTDVQTTDSAWTQSPPDFFAESGRGDPLAKWSSTLDGLSTKKLKRKAQIAKVDSARLAQFLQRSSQVMEVLLEENAAQDGVAVSGQFSEKSNMSISAGCVMLKTNELLHGRSIRDICYSTRDHRLVLIAFSPVEKTLEGPSLLPDKGLLCLWRLGDTKRPHRVLACDSDPTTCALIPSKPSLVFAGTSDGSILVWDLQEPPSSHPYVYLSQRASESSVDDDVNEPIIIRYPSYNTSGIYPLAAGSTHEAPILKIIPLAMSERAQLGWVASGPKPGAGQSVQVATVDVTGVMQIWGVLELRDDSIETAELDYGTKIGSKIRLIKSSKVQITFPNRWQDPAFPNPPITLTTADPIDSTTTRFVFGTDTGPLLHMSRFKHRCHPLIFTTHITDFTTATIPEISIMGPTFIPPIRQIDAVCSTNLCPWDERLILVGYASGLIALFTTKQARPVMTWPVNGTRDANDNVAIKLVKWSLHRPAVFYVLNEQGSMRIWDLSESEADPAYIVHPPSPQSSRARICNFALSPSVTLSAQASKARTASQANLAAASARNATMILTYDDGNIEVHLLEDALWERGIDEEDVLATYCSISQNSRKTEEGT